jgi:hypothetical protein
MIKPTNPVLFSPGPVLHQGFIDPPKLAENEKLQKIN